MIEGTSVRRRNVSRSASAGARTLLLILIVAISIAPIYWLLTTATNRAEDIVTKNPKLYPTFSQLGGITHANVSLNTWFLNSLLVSIGTAAIAVVIGTFAGYGLSRYSFRGDGASGFLVFASQMMPAALLVVPLYGILRTWGVLDSVLSVILAGSAFTIPVAVWVVKGAVDSVPKELDEAARMDGASSLRVFFSLIIPLIRPSIAAAAIVAFFSGWNDFVLANTFLISANHWTVTKGLASLFGQYTVPTNLIMATALLFALPPILFFLILQRWIMSGLTAGAVRG